MRELLAEQIAASVRRNGLVVWEDTAREYADVASSVVPQDAVFVAFDGSWYDLRRTIEASVSGENPPSLVVYAPAPVEPDPLAEIRDAGTKFSRKLATLVEQAHRGRLPPARIATIGKQARTILEAEAAAERVGEADVRLIGALAATDPIKMLVAVLTGSADNRLDKEGLWTKLASLAQETVGAQVSGTDDEFREGLLLHSVLCEIDLATGGSLPGAAAGTWKPPSGSQRQNARDLLAQLQATEGGTVAYRRLAKVADAGLAAAGALEWAPGLHTAVGTPAMETISLTRAVELLKAHDHRGAAEIAERRLAISVCVTDRSSPWEGRWRAVGAIADLYFTLAEAKPPTSATSARLLPWYVESGWQVDRAHRKLETARTRLGAFGTLEEPFATARSAYEQWLDGLLRGFVSTLEHETLEVNGLVRQGEIHDRFVANAPGRTAYIWVDALRYELGEELADALRGTRDTETKDSVRIHAAVAAAPTITLVGMANLLPDAESGLRLDLKDEQLRVSVAGKQVSTVAHRRDLLRARHGHVADLDLNEASQKGEKELTAAFGDADLVLVRSQEVDAAGESGLLSVAWTHFETVIDLLVNLTARLARCGVDRVVISADHGFIALSQGLGTQHTIDPPAGGVGTTKRRVFIGHGGIPSEATVRVPLASCGVSGDLDLVVPRGLAVFRAGGGRQFFHGGLSPQELIVPVIVAELTPAPERSHLKVDIAVAGKRITTGVFSATLRFDDNLFTNQVTVRVVAGSAGAPVVARVVAGDGYDPDTGSVTVGAGTSSVLTFQVTENLVVGTKVDLQVIDGRTGLALASAPVHVAASVTVKDELD